MRRIMPDRRSLTGPGSVKVGQLVRQIALVLT